MRCLIESALASVLALALVVASVAVSPLRAADLPPASPPPPPAAYMPAAPAFTWTGAYVGLNGGYGWSYWSDGLGDSFTGNGFLAGGQVGFNYQVNQLVLGVDADFDWANVKWGTSASVAGTVFGVPVATGGNATNKEEFLSTFGARFGWAGDRLLVYGKAGGAWAREDWNLAASATVGGVAVSGTGSNAFNRLGWMLGAGVEYAVVDNVTVRAEYDFVDFGTDNETLSFTGAGVTVSGVVPSKLDISVVKLGVNVLFH
jgi:outer membrane immunogenic protein